MNWTFELKTLRVFSCYFQRFHSSSWLKIFEANQKEEKARQEMKAHSLSGDMEKTRVWWSEFSGLDRLDSCCESTVAPRKKEMFVDFAELPWNLLTFTAVAFSSSQTFSRTPRLGLSSSHPTAALSLVIWRLYGEFAAWERIFHKIRDK